MDQARINNVNESMGTESGGVSLPAPQDAAAPPPLPVVSRNNNTRSAGVKRLLREAAELHSPNELFTARPLEDNLFEWHFTIRGPDDSSYAGGLFHGRILLPSDYPLRPPNIYLLTPNGRFETGKKICLSISGYHPETWLPSWSIRTALLALVGFMPTHAAGAVGGLDCSDEVRRRLAFSSLDWRCETCAMAMRDVLPQLKKNMEDAVVPKRPSEDDEPISLRQFLQEQQQKHDDAVEAETAVGGGGGEDSTPADSQEATPRNDNGNDDATRRSENPPTSNVSRRAISTPSSSAPSATAVAAHPQQQWSSSGGAVSIMFIGLFAALFLMLLCRRLVVANGQ